MQLPSLRMPALNLGDWFEDFPTWRFALYSLYTVALFALFLVINFPYRVLVDRVLNDVEAAQVDLQDARLSPFKGMELRGLVLRRADISRLPILEVSRAYLKPDLLGLMRGQLTRASLRGELYGGEAKAKWSGGTDLRRTILQVEDLQLARYPLLRELFDDGQIYGLLSGFVETEARGDSSNPTRASGEIYLDRAGTEGLVFRGLPILDVALDETKLVFNVQGGRIEIEEFTSVGPDATISGSGQIGIRQPVESSVLDLKVTIEPSPDARPEIKGLISLIPRQRGAKADAPIAITGTIASPQVR